MIKVYRQFNFITLGLIFLGLLMPPLVMAQEGQSESVPFVVQLTRSDDNYGHRRVFYKSIKY